MEGYFYYLTRTREGRYYDLTLENYRKIVRTFLEKDWSTLFLRRFYRAPKKYYTVCMMLPTMSSSAAPEAFGEAPGSGAFWMAHYKGKIVHPEHITFRFWGVADDFIVVRVGGKIVFADFQSSSWENVIQPRWKNKVPQTKKYFLGHNTKMGVGDWITLQAGEPLDMEVVLGDTGDLATFMLLVEVEGVEYERNRQGGPILPAFKTAELSHDLVDLIYKDLAPNEACLTNGPVFRDY